MAMATMRLVKANDNPRNQVMTDLCLDQAAGIVRANPSTPFAADLVRDYDRYRGQLKPNKQAWLVVIATQVRDRQDQVQQPGLQLTDDFAALTAMFTTAVSRGKKFPKVVLRTPGGLPLCLALAGERSRYRGSLQVTDGGRYPDNVYYGRISPEGTWEGRDHSEVLDFLRAFAADPDGVTAEYGRLTGICCFCQADLTDERSILVGRGPVCSEKHGLPYPTHAEARAERPAPAADLPATGDGEEDELLTLDELLARVGAERVGDRYRLNLVRAGSERDDD